MRALSLQRHTIFFYRPLIFKISIGFFIFICCIHNCHAMHTTQPLGHIIIPELCVILYKFLHLAQILCDMLLSSVVPHFVLVNQKYKTSSFSPSSFSFLVLVFFWYVLTPNYLHVTK